jgi:hypothetical protein
MSTIHWTIFDFYVSVSWLFSCVERSGPTSIAVIQFDCARLVRTLLCTETVRLIAGPEWTSSHSVVIVVMVAARPAL